MQWLWLQIIGDMDWSWSLNEEDGLLNVIPMSQIYIIHFQQACFCPRFLRQGQSAVWFAPPWLWLVPSPWKPWVIANVPQRNGRMRNAGCPCFGLTLRHSCVCFQPPPVRWGLLDFMWVHLQWGSLKEKYVCLNRSLIVDWFCLGVHTSDGFSNCRWRLLTALCKKCIHAKTERFCYKG